MLRKLEKRNRVLILILSVLLFSCKQNIKQEHTNSVDESNDSLVIYDNGIFLYLNGKKPILKEGIYFLKNGDIDNKRSIYVEIKGENLYYHSPYSKYKIGKERFIIFKGNNKLKKNFENVSKLKLDEYYFDEKAKIDNFKNEISNIGIIEETIFLDSIIKNKGLKFKRIRTIKSYIDFENLLINNLEKIK